jgi:hypothetical protein
MEVQKIVVKSQKIVANQSQKISQHPMEPQKIVDNIPRIIKIKLTAMARLNYTQQKLGLLG